MTSVLIEIGGLAAIGAWLGMGVVLIFQAIMLPVALKTVRRKGIRARWCWLFLIPYAGMAIAYWIACAPEREKI